MTAHSRVGKLYPATVALTMSVTVFVMVSCLCMAQQRRMAFNQIDSAEGMPSATVLSILPTVEGPVWFGTTSGLYRYDGKSVQPYLVDANLKIVSALHQSDNGRIWIGSSEGLYSFLDGQTTEIPIPRRPDDRQPTDFVTDFAGDEEHQFFIATHIGLYKLNSAGTLERIILDERPGGFRSASDVVLSIDLEPDGRCLCGTGAGLYLVNQDGSARRIENPKLVDKSLPASLVTDVHVSPDGSRWFVGRQASYRMDGKDSSVQQIVDRNGKPLRACTMFARDAKGRLWLGTSRDELALLDGADHRAQFVPVIVPGRDHTQGSRISTVKTTSDGTIWLGSDSGIQFVNVTTYGFSWCQPQKITGSNDYNTLSARRDQTGRLWLATESHGLQVMAEGAATIHCLTTKDPVHKLAIPRVDFVAMSQAGRIVVGHPILGLFEKKPEGFKKLDCSFAQNSRAPMKSVIFRNESLVVIHGNNCWEEKDGGWHPIVVSPKQKTTDLNFKFHCLKVTSNGRLFFGTGIGLFVEKDDGSFTWCGASQDESIDISMPADNVIDVVEVNDDQFLLASGVGWLFVDLKTETAEERIIEDDLGRPILDVGGIATDADKNIWVTTNKALIYLDLNSRAVRSFGWHHGVQPGNLQRVETCDILNQELCVLGSAGVTVFDSSEKSKYSNPPKFLLTESRVNGAVVTNPENESQLNLSWKENSLTFQLAAFHFQNPTMNRFAFRFSGMDSKWQNIGHDGMIHLTMLPPGDYAVEARARSGDGIWSDVQKIAHFKIVAPLWQRSSFRILALVVLVLLLTGFHHNRIKREVVRNRTLETTVHERTRSLRSRNQELQSIHALLKTINLASSLEMLMEGTLAQSIDAFGGEGGVFLVFDEETALFRPQTSVGPIPGLTEAISRADLRAMLEDHGREVSVGIYLTSRSGEAEGQRRLSLKLMDEDRTHGYLVVDRAASDTPFSGESIALMIRLREPIVMAVKRLQMLDVLGELNMRKTELLGAAAHDLRSPLSAMLLTAENLLSKDPEAAVKNLQQDVGRIVRTVTRMTDLVNKLLDVAAIDSGRLALEFEDTDLMALLASRVAVAEADAKRKRIALSFSSDLREARLRLDEERFAAAIDNLVSNALKYTHAGGHVLVRLDRDHGDFQIAVEDNGQGLPADEVAGLFKSFSRLSAKPTGSETSTGFGLSIVKKIVDLHGGQVWATSQIGLGSTFTISLPEELGCEA